MYNFSKITILLTLSMAWFQLLYCLLPEMVVSGGYLGVAIYYRLVYFRNSQMFGSTKNVPVLVPEVI